LCRKEASTQRGAVPADLITLLLKKRLFSSPAAFARTLDAHIRTLAESCGDSAHGFASKVAKTHAGGELH
jgi:hypothetical protein